LSTNKTLTALDINGNRIGDKAAISLAEAIRFNTTLKYMTLDRNNVDLGGFQAFASSLKTNKTLLGVPPPIEDLESAMNESKDKKRTRERLTAVMNQIQISLAANRGESPGPEFIIPTTSKRRVTYASLPESSISSLELKDSHEIVLERKRTLMNRRETLKLGPNTNLSFYYSPELAEDVSEVSSPRTSRSPSPRSSVSDREMSLLVPPPPPTVVSPPIIVSETTIDDDDMPPPPTPPPF